MIGGITLEEIIHLSGNLYFAYIPGARWLADWDLRDKVGEGAVGMIGGGSVCSTVYM